MDKGPKNANNWANVVIAMLSVNSYNALNISDDLELNGLFDLQNLASWDHPKIFETLQKSGFKRGDFLTGLMTQRLLSLGILADKVQANEQILANGTKDEVTALLSKVKGIGPMVINNFLELRKLKLHTTE